MKSLSTKKIIIAILSALFAFCMFAGLTANKVSANTDLETVTLKTTMEQSAQMRLDNPTGMRFIIDVSEEDVALFGDDIQVVTMITQKNLLDDANIDVADFNKDSAVKMAKIEFNKYNLADAKAVHGSYKLTATILEISDSNIAKNYVAKTYITDGEKIGYVEQATVASIYQVATHHAEQGLDPDDEVTQAILDRYTKSCTVTLEGTDQTEKVPYGIKVSDLVYSMPECYVLALKDLDGNPVALDAVVTTDLVMSISFNHSYVDGACKFCKAACSHSEYENGACVDCGKVCEHEYEGMNCGICGEKLSTYYNDFTSVEGIAGYRSVYFESISTDGIETSVVNDTIGGKTGNFAKFAIGDVSYLAFKITTSLTVEELGILKENGYKVLKTAIYIENTDTVKGLQSYIRGAASVAGKAKMNAGIWYDLSLPIDTVINNYSVLQDGSALWFEIYNGGDGIDTHSSYFNVYVSAMEFVLDTTYNACLSAEGATPTSGKADVAVGTQIGGVTGNYIRYRIWKSYVSLCIPTTQTLDQIKNLQANGYTTLKFSVYIYRQQVAGTDYQTKQCYKLGQGIANLSAYKVNQFIDVEISIQTVIDNYDALQAGTATLFYIYNADSWDGPENGNNTLQVWFSNMEFVK